MKLLATMGFALQLAVAQTDEGALGDKLLSQGFAAQAIPHLEAAGHTCLLGVALMQVNRLPEALHKLLAAYAGRPDDPEVLFYLGECSGSLMQQSFNRLLKLHPDSPRARQLEAPGGPADASALAKALAAYDEHPDDPEAMFQLGAVSRNMMQLVFKQLMSAHATSARARELQARMLLGQGRGADAEPVFRKALESDPQLAGVHLALGRILEEERGDLDGAEAEYRAEVRLRPGNSEAAWRLGSVLLKKGQGKEALTHLQQSDKLKPDMLETLLDLGAAYQAENQIGEAEKAYRRLVAIDDGDELAAAAHLRLSQICRKLGRVQEADQHLKRFRELNSSKDRQNAPGRDSR
jgi:tetratricopeptide (TPR) repeat protein